jgi:hypothetical protein
MFQGNDGLEKPLPFIQLAEKIFVFAGSQAIT